MRTCVPDRSESGPLHLHMFGARVRTRTHEYLAARRSSVVSQLDGRTGLDSTGATLVPKGDLNCFILSLRPSYTDTWMNDPLNLHSIHSTSLPAGPAVPISRFRVLENLMSQ